MAPKLLFYAWDSADWSTLHYLLDCGEMPNLAGLMQRGAIGDLAASLPLVSPMLWASMTTGKTPDAHGIVQSVEADPLTGDFAPPTRRALRTRTLWNILSEAGFRVHTIGLPITHPAEHLSGISVSDSFPRITAPADQSWPIAPGTVWPSEVEQDLAELRVHAGDLTGNDLLYFVPSLPVIDQSKDKQLVPLAVALAETLTLHAAATWVLEHRQWDILAAYSPLIGAVSRVLDDAVTAACRFQDVLLGRLLELAGDDVRVLIVSQCGSAGKPHGLFCFAGPGTVADDLVHGASALDIVPTVLACFDLPVGKDMCGRVLAEAFADPRGAFHIPTWEPSEKREPLEDEAGLAKYLADLGYVDPIADKIARQQAEAEIQGTFFLACSHLASARPEEAIPLFVQVLTDQPQHPHAGLYLAYAYLIADRVEDCEALVQKLPKHPLTSVIRARLAIIAGRIIDALNDLGQIEVDCRWTPFIGCLVGNAYRACGRHSDAERCYRKVIAADGGIAVAHFGLAQSLYVRRDFQAAMEAALDATRLRYDLAPAHLLLGASLLQLGLKNYAATALRTCLKLAPETLPAAHLLARMQAANGSNAVYQVT